MMEYSAPDLRVVRANLSLTTVLMCTKQSIAIGHHADPKRRPNLSFGMRAWTVYQFSKLRFQFLTQCLFVI